jgi:NDP-4-keto-2,6-dideoxyhexose 3-C-methyltransferase
MRTITECRSCGSDKLKTIFDLGEQYVSDFRSDTSKPNKYPLVAVICEDCMLVQLRNTAPSGDMYHENYGFKSGVSDSIKRDLNDIVRLGLKYKPDVSNWLDIASNDGTLLSFVPKEYYRVGVDPIKKYCEEAAQHADLIVNDFFSAEASPEPDYDVITSISCFYDMDDPNKFVGDVASVLEERGIWIIQQNYLLPTLELNAVDNFCHEHLEYYTMLSLEPLLAKHGLEVIKVETSMVNGGSLRTVVAHKGAWAVDPSVAAQRVIEAEAELDTILPYERFAEAAMANLRDLKALVDKINARGEKVYILAASTRGATIWQSAGITEKDCPFAVERNPEKVGKYFSAVGMPIISEEQARADKPEYMLVGPWFFSSEIIDREDEYLRGGGSLIIPLPRLKIV